MELEFLLENLFLEDFGPKGSNIRFFKFNENSMHRIFLILCIMLQQHKILKSTLMIFLGKILF